MFRFEDEEVRDEAYAKLTKNEYRVDIRDMFTQMQMHNDNAQLTGAALKKLILDRLPIKLLEQMHTVDLTWKSNQDMIKIILKARRTAEEWEESKKILSKTTPTDKEKTWVKPQRDKFTLKKDYATEQRNK